MGCRMADGVVVAGRCGECGEELVFQILLLGYIQMEMGGAGVFLLVSWFPFFFLLSWCGLPVCTPFLRPLK